MIGGTRNTCGPGRRRVKVAFVHLDLGIGGAEQLVVNLAKALKLRSSVQASDESCTSKSRVEPPATKPSYEISIYTTVCDQRPKGHSFSEVQWASSPDVAAGILSDAVVVTGAFLPRMLFGRLTALCSTIRMSYLTFRVAWDSWFDPFDCVVYDVLPTPIPIAKTLLRGDTGILYYCHFPDKLLVRNTVNGEIVADASLLRRLYRKPLDILEELTTRCADCVAVNSEFTKEVFREAFTRCRGQRVDVLYPAIEMSAFVPPKDSLGTSAKIGPVVSLNRFERKKNIGLALTALAELRRSLSAELFAQVDVVIAGGYDKANVENVEHLKELETQCEELGLTDRVSFRPSVSDAERATLLQNALCVLYTPHREHFGIVPLEAMFAGSPVVAVASGGPLETVVDGETGFLCEGTAGGFATAIRRLLQDPPLAERLGRQGHEHVKRKFGLDAFGDQLELLIQRSAAVASAPSSSFGVTGGMLARFVTLTFLIAFIAIAVGVLYSF